MNIFVIGCGRWGSLITWYLDHIGHHVTLYGRESSPRMQSFLATRQNDLLTLPESVGLTTDLRDAEQAPLPGLALPAPRRIRWRAAGDRTAGFCRRRTRQSPPCIGRRDGVYYS